MRSLLLAVIIALLSLRAAVAQTAPRVASVTVGVGNAMGWFGLHSERYFARERLSGFAGVGYTPAIDLGDASGPTFAVGLRGFTPGIRHRGFLALSVSQVAVASGGLNPRRFYGPGIEAGYQYVALRGFTFVASVGLGYAPAVPDGMHAVQGMLGLGLGYTWRRRV